MSDGSRGDKVSDQLQLHPMVESYRERKKSGLSGLSLRFDASYGSGAIRPITCRYGLSRGVGRSHEAQSPSSPASSTPSSADSRSPLRAPHDRSESCDSSDIVRAAQDRNTRKEATGRALWDANRVLSETFTLGAGQPTLAGLTEEWRRLPTTSHQPVPADTSDIMRRLGGERKLRPSRPQGPPSAMMIRGHGLSPSAPTGIPGDKNRSSVGRQGPSEDESLPDGARTAAMSQADRERQRIRATMVSMRHEVLGVGADQHSVPPNTRSSGLLEEAASRGTRMRQSREVRITGSVQSTSDASWGARKVAAPRRGPDAPPAPPPAASQELFMRTETRAVRAAPAGQPATQSALGFDSWTVRRSSLVMAQEEEPPPAAPSPHDDQRQRFGDLEIVDDDMMGDLMSDFVAMGGKPSLGRSPVKGLPITEEEGCGLKELMFGSTAINFSPEWSKQNLTFNKTENITYGLVQHKGGPCGVLAALQAYVMKVLLFGSRLCDVPPASDAHQPSAMEQRAALSTAIAEMLWKCGRGTATVALSSGRSQFPGGGRYKTDGITETLLLQQFSAVQPLVAYIRDQLQQFQAAGGAGCVLLTYSAVLSRGVDSVKRDMDMPTNTVIGRHGYCTQELVNLLLTGKAASNVFNDTVQLGEGEDVTVLRGVDERSEIGLLSLFEHYKSCEVGSHLKSPQLPIWVILSESHFTCLFALDRRLCQEPPAAGTFNLFYYDMLAKQDDQIRLTVEYAGDPNADPPPPGRAGELVPPLEHCLRTRWPGAAVNWNGYEPIL